MRSPDIDTLSTYYRTLREPVADQGATSPSRVLSALGETLNGELGFDALREGAGIPPVELAQVLKILQGLKLVAIDETRGDDAVTITPQGKRFVSEQTG